MLTRIGLTGLALPVLWVLMGIEMIVIRFCTKLGRSKAGAHEPMPALSFCAAPPLP